MKRCCAGIFVLLLFAFVAINFADRCFAQATYDFSGTIQIKVGTTEIKEEVCGVVDVTTLHEEEFMKNDNTSSNHGASIRRDTTFMAAFNFEFGSELTNCGDPLPEESFGVKTVPQNNNLGGENCCQARLEFDQNAMAAVIERILKKHGDTVRNAMDLEDCFMLAGTGVGQPIEFLINHITGMAYVKDTYIKISFSGNSEILVSDLSHENRKKYSQKISGKLNIPFE